MNPGLIEAKIISPEEEIFSGEAEMIVLPGEEGDFAAMFEHAPLITYLRAGKIEVFSNEKNKVISYFVSGGFVKIKESKCTVMVDYIKNINEIDVKLNKDKISELLLQIERETDDVVKDNLLLNVETLKTENDISLGD